MREPHERLKEARAGAGFADASEAARSMEIPEPTYLAHENGSRGFKASAPQYARKFGVSLEWLLIERGPKIRGRQTLRPEEKRTVPLVGYVAAGALAHFVADGELGEVDAPDNATPETVAVEIRGDSLGSFFDRWIVFYDDVRRPVTDDLVGRLCVLGLKDGRVVIKKPKKSGVRGLYHLMSQTEEPIFDVAIEWAAKVKSMVPR